jgi:hypothetical protein
MPASAIFGTPDPFAHYRATLVVHGKLIGGIPKDPDTIKKWIESRIKGGADLPLQELWNETVEAMGESASFGEVTAAVASEMQGGNGFKTMDGQLVYEGRCMKAALKEAANIAYPGTEWPGRPAKIRKGLKNYLAETVFVVEDVIGLGVSEPSGTEQRIKHVMTPQGPRSSIGVVDYVEDPKLSFTVAVLDGCIKDEVWGRLWAALERGGIGSDRARGDGQCELVDWVPS